MKQDSSKRVFFNLPKNSIIIKKIDILDSNLSLEAIGLLIKCLLIDRNCMFDIFQLMKIADEREAVLHKSLNELILENYVLLIDYGFFDKSDKNIVLSNITKYYFFAYQISEESKHYMIDHLQKKFLTSQVFHDQ